MNRTNRLAQSGSALITALSVLVITVVLVMMLITHQRVAIRYTQGMIDGDSVYFQALSAEDWAVTTLMHSLTLSDKAMYALSNPIKMPKRISNGATIEGEIFDLQSQFNLTNLRDTRQVDRFANLVNSVDLKGDKVEGIVLANQVREWLVQVYGAEHSLRAYEGLGYHPSRLPMMSLSEFRLIPAVEQSIFQTLQPYLCALPQMSSLNINTASETALMGLSSAMTKQLAESIVRQREASQGFATIDEVMALATGIPLDVNAMTLRSQFYLVKADVTLNKARVTLYSLIQAQARRGQREVIVLWRSRTL